MAIQVGYLWNQLRKALLRRDPAAEARVNEWQAVIDGVESGTIEVGSRTPVEAPPWVSLQVVHGGFTTGAFVAGGPLRPFERQLMTRLGYRPDSASRSKLNEHFLRGDGRTSIVEGLRRGGLVIEVPEEAGIPICVWLQENGHTEIATRLLAYISPWFDELRFYPQRVSGEKGRAATSVISKEDAVKRLRKKPANSQVLKMNEAIHVWAPLYDQAVALLLETVEGDVPNVLRGADGVLARTVDGQPIVIGGLPCASFPDHWAQRVRDFLASCRDALRRYPNCTKPIRKKENFARLQVWLGQIVNDPTAATDAERRSMRNVLARYVGKHGVPQTAVHAEGRRRQMQQTAPLHTDIARAVSVRLAALEDTSDMDSLQKCVEPVANLRFAADGARVQVPEKFSLLVRRTLKAPLRDLLRADLVPSVDVCGLLMPTYTAAVCAEAVDDLQLREVYGPLYQAFQNRRSLLLVNLQSQVRLSELPWVSAIQPWVVKTVSTERQAAQALRLLFGDILTRFPARVLPNLVVSEFRSLQVAAGLNMPLLLELAADIFQGEFVASYLLASQDAARMLRGTLYEWYYDIPYDDILKWRASKSRTYGVQVSPEFAECCIRRTKALPGGNSDARHTVLNGAVIEQAQVMTTHNLATLVDACDLRGRSDYLQLAEKTLVRICQQLQHTNKGQLAKRVVKNVAYAWRQMIFYLTLAGPAAFGDFMRFADSKRSGQFSRPMARLQPALLGLAAIAQGERFDASGLHPRSGGRRLYGWSFGSHWLAAPDVAVRTLSSSR